MKNNVLVCVPDGLVADDVVATVHEVLKAPNIRMVQTIDDVCTTLKAHDGWAWAVVQASAPELGRDDLQEAFASCGALPVVLTEQLTDPAMEQWVFLDPPFNSKMLRSALERTRPF